ncbi:MAG: hypothetical protein R3F34_01320 [Planctomycetota bacterium]
MSIALALALVLLAPATPRADDRSVLFLGNSYTAVNSLPSIVEALAVSGGHTFTKDSNTPGGNTLGAPQGGGQPHATNPTSLAKIAQGGWDAVVLQDQSYLPTIPDALAAWSIPGAVSLAASIHAAEPAARVVLYQTWGRVSASGPFCAGAWCSPAFPNFDAMTDALAAAYEQMAVAAGAEVAPVGLAWKRYLAGPAPVALHQQDGSHPTLAGSYLAACTFYAVLFDESPVGLAQDMGLGAQLALDLQTAAWDTVLAESCGTTQTVDGTFDLELRSGGSVGALVRFAVDGPFAASPVAVFACAAQGAQLPVPGGVLGIDLASVVLGPLWSTNHVPGVGVQFGFVVPNLPFLVGAKIHVQAASFENGGLVLSDALLWRPCP